MNESGAQICRNLKGQAHHVGDVGLCFHDQELGNYVDQG